MVCPICHKTLNSQKETFVCSDHGLLLNGAQLHEARQTNLDPRISKKQAINNAISKREALKCPHCASLMTPVNYVNTGIIIDSCNKCPYRWLDKGEMEKILSHKPRLTAEQLIELEKFDRESKK